MRSETQRYNELIASLEVVHAGVGVANLQPTCSILRISDSQWYNSAGNLFNSATPVVLAMSQVDATNIPGVYSFTPSAAACLAPVAGGTNTAAADGYYVVITEATTLTLEHVKLNVMNEQSAGGGGATAADVWDYDISAVTGSAAKAGRRLRDTHNGLNLGEGATGDALHLATANSAAPDAKFYASTVPAPSADVTEAYANRRAVYFSAGDNRYYPCIVNSVASDGGGNYVQLQREDSGTWLHAIATNDKLLVLIDKFVSISASDIWGESTAAYTSAGTFGEGFRRILSLRQENMRVKYTAWNDVNVPTAGTIYIYPSKAAMEADSGATGSGAFGSYAFTATFQGTPAIQPNGYTSGKLT